MNTEEARDLLESSLARYRQQSYADLLRLLNEPDHFDVIGTSGATYQVEVQAMWDSRRGGNIRIVASIDDGGWRSLAPLAADFILSPDGTFIGE